MKTIFKLLLVLTFCFAALCQRNVAFQVDSIGVAVDNNLVPYLKVMREGSTYYIVLESIYEIYQDPSTSQWLKDIATETAFQSLQWNVTTQLANTTFSLLGAPCPCQNPQQAQDPEPFPITRGVGRQIRLDNLENFICTPTNFDWIQLSFQENIMNNTSCTGLTDISTCTNNCNQVCANATNPTTCNTGCSAITNATSIDTNDCLNACNNDTDCLNACMSVVDCVMSSSCPLYLNYHLHNYQWANSSGNDNSSRKLVFAFQLLPQSDNISCASEFITWFKGPFFLWINTTTLTMQYPDCIDCNPDISAAQQVPTSLFFAPDSTSVIGRVYVDPFTSGFSLFNNPIVMQNLNPTNTTQ